MTHAQSDTGSDGVANRPPAASTIEHELAVEQAHVDLVYTRLAEATRQAIDAASAGLVNAAPRLIAAVGHGLE